MHYKIRVNAVNPLAADTGFTKIAAGAVNGLDPEIRARLEKDVPLRRLTEPRDVAASILFLACGEAEPSSRGAA